MLKNFLIFFLFWLAKPIDFLTFDNDYCGYNVTNCKIEENMNITNEFFKQKLQDRIINVRRVLNDQVFSFKEFFGRTLRNTHLDLDSMFSSTYGSFYQENVQILNGLFERIRNFSMSYSEASMKHIIETFFDDLFLVVFRITNPFQSVTEKKLKCMQEYSRDIEAFGDYPQRIINQLSLPLTNWRHFISAIETLHTILEGYMNITLTEQCQRGLARLDGCAQCANVQVKPCQNYCINILSGCTYQMLESEEVWKESAGLLIQLAEQLNGQQNLVSSIDPVAILISEALMHFQEKSDYITNKMISRCLYKDSESFLYRRKRSIAKPYPPSRRTIDHRILNQMFAAFITKMERFDSLFGNVPRFVCQDEEWGTNDKSQCWNGTSVGNYRYPIANLSNPFGNPEYQNRNILTFRGNYMDERLRMKWLQSRLQNIVITKPIIHPLSVEHINSDDEDYNDYEVEGSADYHNAPLKSPVTRQIERNRIEIVIEPFPITRSSTKINQYIILVTYFLLNL